MIKIIDVVDRQWDVIVKTFPQYDVYYLSGYVKAFKIHGDGEPKLLYYECEDLRAILVYMERSTAIVGVYDIITPYGYGGVLFDRDATADSLNSFWKTFIYKMNELNIVDSFIRYHPVLANAEPMKHISNVCDLGKTIAIDLSSPEVIWENITSKNRNMIRKAEKNGVKICHSTDYKLFESFIHIYNATMDKDSAEDYYYFNREFYDSIYNDLTGNYEIFYAVYGEDIIAMAIILYANKQMHYHLSGSVVEYRNLAPSNLLLYKAALWGCEHGLKTFHLGGGVGSREDNLYKFKAAFNRNSNYQFSVARDIFNQNIYDELVNIRKNEDRNFNPKSNFFPLYRS